MFSALRVAQNNWCVFILQVDVICVRGLIEEGESVPLYVSVLDFIIVERYAISSSRFLSRYQHNIAGLLVLQIVPVIAEDLLALLFSATCSCFVVFA